MKKSLFFLVSLFIPHFLFGQNPLIKQWDYRFGGKYADWLFAIQQTSDDGYILGGLSNSDTSGNKTQLSWDGAGDFWIVKVDSLGNKVWDQRFGGTMEDRLKCLQQTSDGGYILGGWSSSEVGGDKSQPCWGKIDYWIVKVDPLGNKVWDKRFGGSNDDFLYALQQTTDGGYILGGYSTSNISGDKTQNTWDTCAACVINGDYWIVKTDSLGNKQWDMDFGGSMYDLLFTLQQTNDGGYILGGASYSDSSGNKALHWISCTDYWVVKIDSAGNKQWEKIYGGHSFDNLYALKQTTDGGYILGGTSNSGPNGNKTSVNWGGHDFWVIKTDSLGDKEWEKNFGGINDEFGIGNILQTVDNAYIISGASNSPISGDKTESNIATSQQWVVKFDSVGNKQWDKTLRTDTVALYGGGTGSGVLIQTSDLCYVMANTTESGIGGDKTQANWSNIFMNTTDDYWIVKFCDSNMIASAPLVKILANDSSFCQSGCVDFRDVSLNIPTSWHWYFPGAVPDSSTQKNPFNICYSTPGIYNVILVACNHLGCDSIMFTNFIHIDSMPLINLGNDTLICNADSITLDPGAGFTNYLWSNNATSQTITVSSSGNYTVQITMGKCIDSDTIVVTTHTCTIIPFVSFACSDTNFCGKQCIDFYDFSLNNPTSWQWFFPGADSSSSNMQNPTGICYNSFGSFDVTLIACNASGCDTLFLPNFIHEFPNPPVPVVTWIADTLFSTPAYSFQWYYNSTAIPGANTQYYVTQLPGTYFVIVTDSNGCASSSIALTTGINEAGYDNSSIYVIPNPTDGKFILYGAQVNSEIKIYDVAGRIIFSDKIKSSTENLQVKASDGIYFVEITFDEKIIRMKIVLKN